MIDPISSFLRDFVKLRKSELDQESRDPAETQKKTLKWLLFRARYTAFGRARGFGRIRSVADFQKTVPVAHYDDLKPYVARMMAGEPDVLWPGWTKYFTKSSATTGAPKYIPVSRAALVRCHYKGGKDLVSIYLRSNPKSQLFSGKVLSLCGTLYPYPDNPGIEVGDLSAILTKHLPFITRSFRFPPPRLALRDGWEKKIEEISDLAIRENITGLLGVPMWTIVFLKKVLEKSGKKSIYEVWPNLEVFMHGGISFKPYREVFAELLGGRPIRYIESYNASEGYFAIEDGEGAPGEMRLMLDYGIFYEFIPLDAYQRGDYAARTVADVELGVNYAIVITTNGGLWRYVLGDTVEFTSLAPLRLKITGRTKQYLNLYDEEVSVEHAENAIADACRETGATVLDFTMCPTLPDEGGRGTHEWVVEFSTAPADPAAFIRSVDESLIRGNGDYAERRTKDVVLGPPVLHVVPEKTFYNWMKERDRLGGQFKVQRISNSREHVEDILRLAGR